MLNIEVRLYGAFREYSQDPWLRLQIEVGTGLIQLREMVRCRLEALQPGSFPADLLAQSVFADETDILPMQTSFTASQKLSLIPPVCGG